MADEAQTLSCEVAYARPDRQFVIPLTLPPGTTAREALLRSGIAELCREILPDTAVLGVYGRVVSADHVLREGDRLEIYRPLAADPRAARRERVRTTRRRR